MVEAGLLPHEVTCEDAQPSSGGLHPEAVWRRRTVPRGPRRSGQPLPRGARPPRAGAGASRVHCFNTVEGPRMLAWLRFTSAFWENRFVLVSARGPRSASRSSVPPQAPPHGPLVPHPHCEHNTARSRPAFCCPPCAGRPARTRQRQGDRLPALLAQLSAVTHRTGCSVLRSPRLAASWQQGGLMRLCDRQELLSKAHACPASPVTAPPGDVSLGKGAVKADSEEKRFCE